MIWSKKNKRDGETYWYVRYPLKTGRRKKECVPPSPDGRPTTKQDAREYLTKQKAAVDAGTWVDPDARVVAPVVPDTGPTFAKFAETFLRDHPGARRSNHYPSNVSELVKEFGDRPLREITRADLDAYRVKLQTTARPGRMIPKAKRVEGGPERLARPPLTSTTVLKRLRALHRMFKMAARWGVLAANPAADLEKPSPNNGKTRFLTREEYDQLEAAAAPWLQSMLRLAVSTGMRLKEVATQRWDSVNLKAMVLHVEQDTKTGTRAVPISQSAKAVLDAQQERRKKIAKDTGKLTPFVFAADDATPYDTVSARRRISEATRSAARAAGLGEGVGFHILRHTAASWMVQGGVNLYEVQRYLGHSTPTLTQRYGHLQPDNLKGAAMALDAVLQQKAKV
jgi:integrase